MKVLLTGCAGFIGSHLLEECLLKGWSVIGVDNMSTGREENLAAVFQRFNQDMSRVKFTMIRRDVLDLNIHAVAGVDVILHQAALGSVPRSIEDPVATYRSNDAGFFHILNLARIARVKRVVYASSSSVYGDNQISARDENQRLGLPLSPYAATKQANEAYAAAFCRSYKMDAIGLRYFNVYGPRQATHAYTGVIARWADDMRGKKPVYANGDLGISRDFGPARLPFGLRLALRNRRAPIILGSLRLVRALEIRIRASVRTHRHVPPSWLLPVPAGREPHRPQQHAPSSQAGTRSSRAARASARPAMRP